MHKCRVPGCSSVSQLLHFPRDEVQLKKWVQLIKNPVLDNMSAGLLYKIERICIDHFEDKYFRNDSTITNKILLDDVDIVPSLSLPGSNKQKCIAHLTLPQLQFSNTKQQVITQNFARRLKTTVLNLPALDRICVLLFKTVKLSPKLVYDSNYDMIFGYSNTNYTHTKVFAKNAIVFMVRGLYSNWKQLLSFVFYNDENDTNTLIQSLKDVITTCFSLRLKVIATVCETNKFNVATMNEFSQQSHEKCLHDHNEYGYQSFTVDNHEIIVLYDTIHLFKKVRNELNYENNNINDMLQFFVRLFNSLDGRNTKINVTLTSEHWELWRKSIETLQNMKIVDETPSCFQQWTTTLFGVMQIWRGILQRSNFKSFSPRFLQLRELNKVTRKIRSFKKEPIRYMDYDEVSYTKYLNRITNKINLNTYNKPLTCNNFVNAFKNEITSFEDNSLPLCDATRPLLFEKIQQISDKNANFNCDYDYRNLELGMTKHSKPLVSAPEFLQFDYDPILHFDNSTINWTLNKNQLLKMLPLHKIKLKVEIDILRILKTNNCNDCNIFGHDKNLIKMFAIIVANVLTELPKHYNKPKLTTILTKRCLDTCDFEFNDCEEHNLIEIFINCCVNYIIKFWVVKINRCLTKECLFYSNLDCVTKQAIFIGKKGKIVISSAIRNRRNKRVYKL